MNQYITIAEAILISITSVLVWAFIKTLLKTIENKNK
jgi:hypothetical protein